MKKLLFLLATVGMVFTACQSGSLDDGSNGGNGSGNSEVYDPNNPLNNKKCSNNEILYISKSCLPMELNNYDGWGAKLISNTYENGVGRLTFNGEVTTIPKNAFSGNDLLEFIKMPKSVTSIGESTFSGCTSLTSITIPNSVTSIGNRAFEGCTGELIIDSNALGLYGGKFTKLTIGDSVTSIGGSAFSGCDSLTSVIIGNNVTSIGMYAFYNCTSLTSITIPDSVTSIEDDAFEGCSSLTSVYYKGGLSAWCKMSFNDAYANPLNNGTKLYLKGVEVTDITIPSDITEIKDYTFYGCTSLTSITIPNSVTSIGGSAFYGCTGELKVNCNIPSASSYQYRAFYNSKFTKVTIGDSVTSIGDYAFYECTSLTSVTIGNGVTSIGEDAFCRCTSLTSVTIPDSVTSIGIDAFVGCRSLTSVTIGNSVTEIGNYAFYGCTSLKEVYCKPATPPTGGSSMFSYYNGDYRPIGCKIYVPRNSVDVYKSASYWRNHADYIEGYDF